MISLAKDIRTKLDGKNIPSEEEVVSNFPNLLWAVRDFTLQMVDSKGSQISPKEYLENALALQKGVSDAVDAKNRVRRLLRHYFVERDCIKMVRPVELERDLQNLQTLPDKMLRR